jgi:filamentous hemagglutinin family protein
VNQHTDRAVINWNSFSIANGELTKFVQPNSTSSVLNRVVTANPSQIYGTLQGNGNIFLINPSGVLVGAGGQVNTASFMASTRDVSTEDFMKAGTMNFTGNSDASVINQGKIEATSGDVFLVAKEVKNEGQIMAKDGTVGLVSGTSVTLETVGPGRHYKVRLMDVDSKPDNSKASEAAAEIVNEGVIEAANVELEATGNYLSLAIKNTGTIRATGLVQNADGSVTLTGGEGDVLNTGVVAALQKSVNGAEQGGKIDISGRNIRAEEGSLITASGQEGGGNVKIQSKNTTMLAGRVEATGYSAKSKGGRVEALGTRVGLRSGEINVDGGAKGGTVLVGGDYLGSNRDVPNAKSVAMLPDAKISANARENGDGGKVILWSDEYTGFFGKITALGGAEGGNGGFIETSSKNNLQAFGEAQASAPKGFSGEWLLDPYNVTIVNAGPSGGGGFSGGNPDIFVPTANNASVFNQDINRALNSGTSVTITTGSSGTGSQAGNITVTADITKTKDTPPTSPDVVLTLSAANNILILDEFTISSTAGSLGISLLADSDKSGVGFVDLRQNVSLKSNAGDIVLQSASGLAINSTVSIDATMLTSISTAIWGGQRFSGNVTIQPSSTLTATSPATTVDVGGSGTGALKITQAMVNTITLLDPQDVTSAKAGYLTLGSRSAGDMKIGLIQAGPTGAYNLRLASGGNITQSAAGVSVDTSGIVVLDSAGRIGDAFVAHAATGNPIGITGNRLGVITEGDSFQVSSTSALRQLYVQTDGTVADQKIADTGANLRGNNLNYDVYESGLTTYIGAGGFALAAATPGGVGGLYVDSGAIDFSYINTGGGITVGTAGITASPTVPAIYGAVASVWPGISFGIMAVQDPVSKGVGTASGKVSLSANGSVTVTQVGVARSVTAAAGTSTVFSSCGGVFTGGGDLNIYASDLVLENAASAYDSFNAFIPLMGPQFGAALNTFRPVLNNSPTPTAGVPDFGVRNNNMFFNVYQISGLSGIVSINPKNIASGPSPIYLTQDGSGGAGMKISRAETFNMEGGAVQIGGMQAGDINLAALNTFITVTYGKTTPTGGQTKDIDYTARYFENPYYGGNSPINTYPTNPQGTGGGLSVPYPHVQDISVSFVSGAGQINLDAGGDVNVGTLNATSIGGVTLVGNTDNAIYAPTGVDILAIGSQLENLSGRLGRTILDTQISLGNSFSARFAAGNTGQGLNMTINDSTDSVVARGVLVPDTNGNGMGVGSYSIQNQGYGRFKNPQVIVSAPDLVSGSQATATAVVNPNGTIIISSTSAGSGYLKPPTVIVVDGYTPANAFLAGASGQQAGANVIVDVTTGKVTGVTPLSDPSSPSTSFLLGGSGYGSAPEVALYSGGIQQGAARAVVNDYGQIGVIAAVQAGEGYKTAPTVSISGGGGVGAVASAVLNANGQLTPYNVTAGGPVFHSTPTIEVISTDGKGGGAVARPIMQGNGTSLSLVGIQPVDAGQNYTPGSTVLVKISGGGVRPESIPDTLANAVVNADGKLGSFVLVNPGSGYTSEPTITLTGGGIAIAQARSYVDLDPLSINYGKVTAYELANAGAGYTGKPVAVVGVGGPTGQFGEVGVRTDVVDRDLGSGSISILNAAIGVLDVTSESLRASAIENGLRLLSINAPVVTGDSEGSSGGNAISGSVILAASGSIVANANIPTASGNALRGNFNSTRGLIQTGDANLALGGGQSFASSGTVRVLGLNFQDDALSALSTSYAASYGFPVQLGLATGGLVNSIGTLSAETFGPITGTVGGSGILAVFAPAPGQMETLLGQPLNSNLSAPSTPRVSNDLEISALNTANGIENPVRIDVGAVEGFLSLNATETLAGVPIVTFGQITFIQPTVDGRTYIEAPTIVVSGGGIVTGQGKASIANGTVTGVQLINKGDGYSVAPTITILGGGGTGATAQATIDTDPTSPTFKQIKTITVTSQGSGYTSLPTISITSPKGVATSAAATYTSGGGITALTPTVVNNAGYFATPTVVITDPTGSGAVATPIISSAGIITGFQIVSSGTGYTNPTITIGSPATQATAAANLNDVGEIISYTITNAGGGYTSAPSLAAAVNGTDPFNLDIDHAGFFADNLGVPPIPSGVLIRNGTGNEQVTASVVGIGPFTNQRPVSIGANTPQAFSVLQPLFSQFSADALVIGTRKFTDPAYGAGVITIYNSVDASNLELATFALAGTRQVQDIGGTSGISFPSFAIDAGGEVSLTGAGNKVHYFSGVIRDSGLASEASFEINSSLRTTDGYGVTPLTIGEVNVNAPEFTGRRFYQGIETQDGDITVRANDIELTRVVGFLDTTGGGAIPVSTSVVTLSPLTTGGTRPISINYNGPSKLDGTSASASYFGFTAAQVEIFGSGYTSVPTVKVSAPDQVGGVQAQATAQMVLGAINTAGGIGSGYTSIPTVTISAPTIAGGITATGEAVVDFRPSSPTYGKVIGVRITNQGSGYTTSPNVTFSGGGGLTASTSSTLAVKSILLAGGTGYTTAPSVTIASPTTAGGVTATATGLLGSLSLRINNPAQLEMENIRAASVVIGASSGGSTLLSSAGNITLNTDFGYNYGLYPYAPRTLALATDGSVTLGISQIPPSPSPTPVTSSIKMPNFSVTAGGAVNLGQYLTAAAPNHTINFISALLTGANQSFTYSTGITSVPLTVADLSSLGGAAGITTASGGSVTLSAPNIVLPAFPPNAAGQSVNTINSGANVNISSTISGGKIQVAVMENFNSAYYAASTVVAAGDITMTSDRIELGDDGVTNTPPPSNLSPALLAANTTSGIVTLQTYTAGRAITLGDKTTVDSNFTAAELSNIQGNILRIGKSTAGAILVDALISLSTTRLTGAFSLIGNSTIGDSGGSTGISYAGGLRLSANSLGGLLPLLNNNVINFTGTGNNFGTVAASSNGNVLNPNCYNIVLSSGAFSIGTADSLTGITGLGSRVTLQPNVAGTAIDLGTKSGWSFTDFELDLVTASILQIGRSNAGQITVSAAMTLPSTVPILDLETAAGVADDGDGSGISVTSLVIRAGTGAVSLDRAGNNVSNLAGVVTGPFSFTDNVASAAAPLNITTVDGLSGIDTSAGNGAITLTANDMNIVQAVTAGTGVITLQPLDPTTNISLNDPTASLALSTAELQFLSSSSTVIIGRANGTGTISIGGNGSINLSGETYSFTLRGVSSPVVFNGGMKLATGKTFTLNVGTGAVTSPFIGTDITIGGTGVLSIVSAGSVGTLSAPLTTSVAQLSGALIAAASTANLGGLFLSNATALDVTGAVSVTGNTTALGNINLTTSAGGLSNSTGSITSTDGSVTLLGATTVTIGRAVSAATTLTATASGGALVTGAAGTLTAGGNITGTGTTAVTVDGAVNSGGAISFTATTPLTGTFANSARITSTLQNPLNSDGTFSPTITLQADTVNLGAVVTAQPTDPTGKLSGSILLEPVSVGRNIEVFGATQTVLPGFFISDAYFGFLGGAAPVTIGRLNGTGTVLVHAKAGINRNLTIQAGAQPFALTPTFTIDGSVTTTGSDLAFNGGGGYLLLDAGISIDSGAGSISLTGQKVEINGDVVAGFIGNVYNGGTGGAYLNYVGPPTPTVNDLLLSGTGTITTGTFGFGGNGVVYVGNTNVGGSSSIGGVTINSQGLSLSSKTKISLEGNITSVGDPLTIDGNLYLTGNRVISMGGGNLKLLGGVNSVSGFENLNLNMGSGGLTLAGGSRLRTDRMGTLTVDEPGTIQFGQALAKGQAELGLTMGFTKNLNLLSPVTLEGSENISLTGYSGADLTLGSFSEATSATAPLALTTVGGGDITTGAVAVSSLTVTSSGSATLGGAVNTTGATTLTTGTTLSTQAISASTLNVSAGTAATLGGAVATTGATTVQASSLTTSSTVTAATGGIQIFTDTMSLAGQVTATEGNVQVGPYAAASQLVLGGAGMTSSTLLKLQAPKGTVILGRTDGTGGILVAGAVDLSTSETSNYEFRGRSGGLTFQGTVTLPSADGMLTLNLGVGDVTSSGGLDYSGNVLQITQARDVNIGTLIPTFGSMAQSFRSIHLRNYGSLTIAGPIDASGSGTGTISIRTLSGDLTLASTIKGGLIQLGAAQNFNNQAGASPFTNRGGGRTLVYSAGQRFDTPYNFAGLNGFGVAFGQPYGSMPSSGNYLVYSSYADVGLANGWQYGSFFAGNSVSALMPYGLFEDVNRLYQPNARSFNLEYMLYPDRVEPETRTLPAAMLGNLEEQLGRPPTLEEIQAREVAVREAAMVKKGAILERSSFDPAIEEKDEEERAEGEKVEKSDGGVPQAKVERIEPIRDGAKPMARLPVSAPQAGKTPTSKQGSNGPILRAGPIRSVALLRPAAPTEGSHADMLSKESALLDAKSVIEQERASAEVGIAPPIAAGR